MKEDLELLGKYVADQVSGFRGIVMRVLEWQIGSTQFDVCGEATDWGQRSLRCFKEQLKVLDDPQLFTSTQEYTDPTVYFGRRIVDKFTPFQGTIVGRVFHCFSHIQLCVIPYNLDSSGQIGMIEFMDPSRCQIWEPVIDAEEIAQSKNGDFVPREFWPD